MLTELKHIKSEDGAVFHAIKDTDQGFVGFGEAYFSTVKQGHIKGWKRHHEMTMNLVVIFGCVKFVIYIDNDKKFKTINLSLENYQRLTVPPGYWIAFQGIGDENIILNVADIKHDPAEIETLELSALNYEW